MSAPVAALVLAMAAGSAYADGDGWTRTDTGNIPFDSTFANACVPQDGDIPFHGTQRQRTATKTEGAKFRFISVYTASAQGTAPGTPPTYPSGQNIPYRYGQDQVLNVRAPGGTTFYDQFRVIRNAPPPPWLHTGDDWFVTTYYKLDTNGNLVRGSFTPRSECRGRTKFDDHEDRDENSHNHWDD